MSIEIKISGDNMEATSKLERRDVPFDIEEIDAALKATNVLCGVDDGACRELIAAINLKNAGCQMLGTVAHGVSPIAGEDGTAEMIVKYARDTVGLEDELGNIDFRDRGSFTPIEKDQLIANFVGPTPGTAG
jgi:uncharacterized protein (DUF342 family)